MATTTRSPPASPPRRSTTRILAGESERRFVDDIDAKLALYGERTRLSERQRNWLRDIWRRLREAGADPTGDGDAVARPVAEAP